MTVYRAAVIVVCVDVALAVPAFLTGIASPFTRWAFAVSLALAAALIYRHGRAHQPQKGQDR